MRSKNGMMLTMNDFVHITKNQVSSFCLSEGRVAKITDSAIDIDKALSIIELSKKSFISKDNYPEYKSLGLQFKDDDIEEYNSSCESIRYIDANHKIIINESDFKFWKNWNTLGQQLSFLRDGIDIALFRSRLLTACGGYSYQSKIHIDYDWRYVVPLSTNDQCTITYTDENMEFHLPADGSAYVFNAGFLHSFKNFGLTDRCHFIGILDIPNSGDNIIRA